MAPPDPVGTMNASSQSHNQYLRYLAPPLGILVLVTLAFVGVGAVMA